MADALPGVYAPLGWGNPSTIPSFPSTATAAHYPDVEAARAIDVDEVGAANDEHQADREPVGGATQRRPDDRVPTPHELLRLLDGWLMNCRYGADHPWRLSIARTLAEYPEPGMRAPRSAALEVLLYAQLRQVEALFELLDQRPADDQIEMSGAIRALVGIMGWLSRRGLVDFCGHVPDRGSSASRWLLLPGEARLLDPAGSAA